MAEEPTDTASPSAAEPAAGQQPPYVIEGARSSRSRCKTCRRTIAKGALRIGVLVEGPYGTGYMWHHLTCLARRRIDQLEEAYEREAWRHAKEPPPKLPGLDELRQLREEADKRREEKKELPYAEIAPSARSKCKQCDRPIEKDALRVVLGREVEFGGQVRVGPIKVHPACVAATLALPDTATKAEGLRQALAANSGLDEARLGELLDQLRV